MKIIVYGLGEAKGRRFAQKIKQQLSKESFRILQNTEISFGYVLQRDSRVSIKDVAKGETGAARRLGEFIKKSNPKSKVSETITLVCSLPKARLRKGDKILSRVCQGNPMAKELFDIFEVI